MTMTEIYYRVHWDGRHAEGWRAFDAANAWSRPWGADAVLDEDGAPSLYSCVPCDGTGLVPDAEAARGAADAPVYDDDRGGWICPDCDGEGTRTADRGYSCLATLDGLKEYLADTPGADVAEFEGNLTGWGCDGEPLVVPTTVVRWMTIKEAMDA